MTDEQILALRPGDRLQAVEADEIEGADGIPVGVKRVLTPGVWTEAAINHLRGMAGLPPLTDEDDDG